MAEENQQKKKPGIVRRILKWIGLAVLILLLTVSIVFQASWKISALLLIILLACTALPKPARKWFWLCVGGVIIAMVIWVFLPDDNSDWRPFTFEDELAAIEAKRAIPDEENAAVIYNELLDNYDSNSFFPDFWQVEIHGTIMPEPWLGKDHPKLAEWLKGHQGMVAKLLEASQKQKCRFSINADPLSFDKTTNRLAPMRRLAKFLVYAGNNDIAEERIDQALEKYIAVLQIADHLNQQPASIYILVAMSLEALAIHTLNATVVDMPLTETQLKLIEGLLAKNYQTWSQIIPRVIEYDRLSTKNDVGRLYEVDTHGKIHFSLDPSAQARQYWEERFEKQGIGRDALKEYQETYLGPMIYLTYFEKKLLKAETILRRFTFPSTPQKAALFIDKQYEKLNFMSEPDYNWHDKPEPAPTWRFVEHSTNFRKLIKDTVRFHCWIYHSVQETYLRNCSHRNSTRIIIALRRYKNKTGVWPTSLDDIKSEAPAEIFIDPINNDSYVYILTKDNFMLYSKGKNNIDENGEYQGNWPGEAKPDDRLIWPTKKCKEQEENTDAE